jgi:hypothetical protein
LRADANGIFYDIVSGRKAEGTVEMRAIFRAVNWCAGICASGKGGFQKVIADGINRRHDQEIAT